MVTTGGKGTIKDPIIYTILNTSGWEWRWNYVYGADMCGKDGFRRERERSNRRMDVGCWMRAWSVDGDSRLHRIQTGH